MKDNHIETISIDELPALSRSDLSVQAQLDSGIPGVPTLPIFAYGPKTGGLVVLVAGQHGDEPESVAVVSEVGRRLSYAAESLGVRVIGIPILNPPAHLERSRVSPADGLDMNRMFVADNIRKDTTARLAGSLLKLLEQMPIDLLVDVHSGGAHEFMTHIRTHRQGGSEFWGIAGPAWIQQYELPEGFLIRAMSDREVPAYVIEVGGSIMERNEIVGVTDGLIGLFESRNWPNSLPTRSEFKSMRTVHQYPAPPAPGFFNRLADLGGEIREGDRLGTITDCSSGEDFPILAAADGILAATSRPGLVIPGTRLYDIVAVRKEGPFEGPYEIVPSNEERGGKKFPS